MNFTVKIAYCPTLGGFPVFSVAMEGHPEQSIQAQDAQAAHMTACRRLGLPYRPYG
jgi:hypothetical protein